MIAEVAATSTQRVALVIQYLGTRFHGWQRQPGQRTVQGEIEKVLQAILNHSVTLHAAGRTDSGVHAAAQVAHFQGMGPFPASRWVPILNARLPDDIVILASAAVSPSWHARFSALWRRYRYLLYTAPQPNLFVQPFSWHYYHAPLDESQIQKALQPLVGKHNLEAFRRAGSTRPHSWVEVQAAECRRRGEFLQIEIQASGFLYGMVRLIVGLLVQVGRGLRSPENFTALWVNQQREHVKYAAPACGLCLLRVGYPVSPFSAELQTDSIPQLMELLTS